MINAGFTELLLGLLTILLVVAAVVDVDIAMQATCGSSRQRM